MAIKTQAQLEAQAAIIRDEVASKANTANRVGVMVIDFVQSIYDSAATGVDITAAIDALKDSVPLSGDTLNKLYLLIQDLDAKIQPTVAKNYIDTASMIADQLILPQVQGSIYSVGTYPDLDYYQYLGTTVGDITDYSLIGAESLDVFTKTEIQNNIGRYVTDTGAANAYIIILNPVPVAYLSGQEFTFKASNANTGASTLNVNSLGVKSIVKRDGTALSSGDIPLSSICKVVYDGINFQLISSSGGGATSLQDAYDGGSDIELDGINNLRVLKNGGLVTVFELDQVEQSLVLEGKSSLGTDYSLWIVDDLGSNLLKVFNDGSVEFGGSVSSFLEVQAGITSGNAGIQFLADQTIAYRMKDASSFDYLTFKSDTLGIGRGVRIRQKLIQNQGTGFESYVEHHFLETSATNNAQNIVAIIPIASGFMSEIVVQHMSGRGANGNVISANKPTIIARNVAGTLTGVNDTLSTLLLGASDGSWNINYNDTSDQVEIRFQNEVTTGQVYNTWVQISVVTYPTS